MKMAAESKIKNNEIIIDAENALLGRLASFAAKQALKGKEIIIVNSEKAVVSGNKKNIIEDYRKKRARGGSSQKGPYFPKQPERVLKRTIRGMLPKTRRGKEILKSIKCYYGAPEEYKDSKKIIAGKKKNKVMSIKELLERT